MLMESIKFNAAAAVLSSLSLLQGFSLMFSSVQLLENYLFSEIMVEQMNACYSKRYECWRIKWGWVPNYVGSLMIT